MFKSQKISLCFMAALSAMVFWACKEEEPNPRTVAQEQPAEAPEASDAHSRIKAKVRKVLGETDLQRKGSDKWSKLRYGQNVVERDRIRTGAESEAVMTVSDGSSLWISELSDVTLDVEIFDSLSRQVSVHIENGSVMFDVQKQPQGQTFKFNTKTATAAIRGTAGFVGDYNGQMVASLKEGRVSVSDASGTTEDIVENQTLIVNKNGNIKKLKLKSSGTRALVKTIAELNAKDKEAAPETIEKTLVDFDNDYSARKDAFEKKLSFRANALPDTVLLPSVTLQARVNPGVVVTVLGESDTVGENGIYQRTVDWADDAYGPKRFLVSCSEGDVEIPCFMWTTVYAAPSAPAKEEPVADTAAVEEPATDKEQQEKAKIKETADKARAAVKEDAKAKEQAKAADKPKTEEKTVTKNLNVSLKISGGKSEKKHLDLPANEYNTKLKFSLGGMTDADLDEIAGITVKHKGEVVQSFSTASGLTYEVPVSIDLNTIAKFDIEVSLKNGKKVRATKTYEVFCHRRNHMGKARNCVQLDKVDGGGCDDSHEEEYQYVKDNGILKED